MNLATNHRLVLIKNETARESMVFDCKAGWPCSNSAIEVLMAGGQRFGVSAWQLQLQAIQQSETMAHKKTWERDRESWGKISIKLGSQSSLPDQTKASQKLVDVFIISSICIDGECGF